MKVSEPMIGVDLGRFMRLRGLVSEWREALRTCDRSKIRYLEDQIFEVAIELGKEQ